MKIADRLTTLELVWLRLWPLRAMTMIAICVRCGEEKSSPYEQCDRCQFAPKDVPNGLLKSVYLSTGRFDSDDEKARYATELCNYAKKIRRGHEIDYDPMELARLRKQRAEIEAIDDEAVLGDLLRLFLPGILLLIVLVAVLIALKQL